MTRDKLVVCLRASTERPIDTNEWDWCSCVNNIDVPKYDDFVCLRVKENEWDYLFIEDYFRSCFWTYIALTKTTNETQIHAEPPYDQVVFANTRGDWTCRHKACPMFPCRFSHFIFMLQRRDCCFVRRMRVNRRVICVNAVSIRFQCQPCSTICRAARKPLPSFVFANKNITTDNGQFHPSLRRDEWYVVVAFFVRLLSALKWHNVLNVWPNKR